MYIYINLVQVTMLYKLIMCGINVCVNIVYNLSLSTTQFKSLHVSMIDTSSCRFETEHNYIRKAQS